MVTLEFILQRIDVILYSEKFTTDIYLYEHSVCENKDYEILNDRKVYVNHDLKTYDEYG